MYPYLGKAHSVQIVVVRQKFLDIQERDKQFGDLFDGEMGREGERRGGGGRISTEKTMESKIYYVKQTNNHCYC